MDNKDCIFCRIIAGDIPSETVYADEDILVFNDVDPKADVHVLAIPKKHISILNDLSEEDIPLAGKMIFHLTRIAAEKNISESGYRIVGNCNRDAGQEVFHVHFHLLGGRKFSWPPG